MSSISTTRRLVLRLSAMAFLLVAILAVMLRTGPASGSEGRILSPWEMAAVTGDKPGGSRCFISIKCQDYVVEVDGKGNSTCNGCSSTTALKVCCNSDVIGNVCNATGAKTCDGEDRFTRSPFTTGTNDCTCTSTAEPKASGKCSIQNAVSTKQCSFQP